MEGTATENTTWLPPEVWFHIFHHLDCEALQSVMQAFQFAYRMLMDDQVFWFRRCKAALATAIPHYEFKLDLNVTTTWRDLYINVISPYKYLLGYWQRFSTTRDVDEYRGMVLRFRIFPERGVIEGCKSMFDTSCYRFESECCITIDGDGAYTTRPDVLRSLVDIGDHKRLTEPVYTCSAIRPQDEHCAHMNHVYSSEVMVTEGLVTEGPDTTPEKSRRWVKLRPLTELPQAVVEPGLYKALYGIHGYELIHVFYLESERKIIGSKIFGDNNVPFGKHTFVIDTDKPVMLSEKEQQDIEMIRNLNVQSNPGGGGPQPFVVPPVHHEDDQLHEFATSEARYAGSATCAYSNYTDPWWSDVHYIRFDSNNFAIFFIELETITLYKRQPQIQF